MRLDLCSLCSGVKECGTKRAHNCLFPKSSFRIRRTTDLEMFKDSAFVLDAIRRSFLTKSATTAMLHQLESILDDQISRHLLPSPSRLEIVDTTFDRFTSFCTNTGVPVADRPALKQNFKANPCSFPPSVTYKENRLYKTSYNS